MNLASVYCSFLSLSSIDGAVAATSAAFGEERLDPSPSGVLVSVLTVSKDHKANFDFEDICRWVRVLRVNSVIWLV